METASTPPDTHPSLRPYTAVLLGSLLLFGLACILPSLQLTAQPDSVWPGFALLLMGWLGFFIFQFGWTANLPYALGLLFLLLRKPLLAFLAFGLAVCLSLNTLLMFSQTIPANESTMEGDPLYALLPGFYVWLAAMLVGTAGSLYLWLRQRRS
jgi:hypothetical protein